MGNLPIFRPQYPAVRPKTEGNAAPLTRAAGRGPTYDGACMPIAADVDCAGGIGNSPAYVQGPVTPINPPIFLARIAAPPYDTLNPQWGHP